MPTLPFSLDTMGLPVDNWKMEGPLAATHSINPKTPVLIKYRIKPNLTITLPGREFTGPLPEHPKPDQNWSGLPEN